MGVLDVYIPMDRRQALARGEVLPDRAKGAVLFADIRGFTPLAEAMARELGPQRAAEELTYYLNRVYESLIAQIHRYGGSVIGFVGDAITCWFGADNGLKASACALAMQRAMAAFAAIEVLRGETAAFAIKIGISAGPVRRFRVGSPQIQYIDVLAGSTLRRMSLAEGLAQEGETLLAAGLANSIPDDVTIVEWRVLPGTGQRFAVLGELVNSAVPTPWPHLRDDTLTEAQVRPWVLPPVYERLKRGASEFLAELRPAVSLFLKFAGIEYDCDESAGDKLDAYIRWVQDIVSRYGGSLIQLTIGDKGSFLYAAFGATVAHDDDAVRAVVAALELRKVPSELDFITATHIGLGRGQARTGPYGSSTRRSYGVIGDDAVLAARLMDVAPSGQIRCDYNTYQSARDGWAFETLAPVRVKGKVGLIRTYQPVDLSTTDRGEIHGLIGMNRRSVWGEGRLVGRTEEVAQLESALEALKARKSRVLIIKGEAGIGKSRMVAELTRLARESGLTWLLGSGHSVEQQIPYRAWRGVFSFYFGLEEVSDPVERRARVQKVVREVVPQQVERLPLLNDILNLDLPETDWTAALDPIARQQSLVSFLLVLLWAWVLERSLIVVLEDAHWLDSLSWELAVQVARASLTWREPMLLVLVTRLLDEHDVGRQYTATLEGMAIAETLSLNTLSADEIVTLVTARLDLPEGGLPGPVAHLVRDRAEGNPFFAEELVFALRDQNIIAVEADPIRAAQANGHHCVVTGDLIRATQALPHTVQGLVLARIDQLSPERQLTLKIASVVGRSFSHAILSQIMERHTAITNTALKSHLDALDALDLTPLSAREPLTYSFKHVITQEVAYQTLLYAQRRALHRSVAEALEKLYSDRIDEQLGLLAHHWSRADVPERAIPYLLRAGERALLSYADGEAVAHFERVLTLLGEISQCELLVNWRLQSVKGLGQIYLGVGELGRAEQLFREAIELGQQVGISTRERLRLYHWLGETLFWESKPDDLLDIGREGMELIASDPDLEAVESVEAALVNQTLAIGYLAKGDRDRFRELTLRTARFIQRLPYSEVLRPAYAHIITAHMDTRKLDEAIRWTRILEEKAEACYDLRASAEVWLYAAQISELRGDLATSVSRQQQALKLFTRIGDHKHESWCLPVLARLFLALGDLQQAEACAFRGLETAWAARIPDHVRRSYRHIAQVALCRGDWESALANLGQVAQIARSTRNRGDEAGASYDLGRVYLAQGDREAALRELQEAFALIPMEWLRRDVSRFAAVLSGLEEAYHDPEAFRAFCRDYRMRMGSIGKSVTSTLDYWSLEPVESRTVQGRPSLAECFGASLPSEWLWQDPFGDCWYRTENGLEIYVANGRDLVGPNLSAPRVLCTLSATQDEMKDTRQRAGLVVQTVCTPALDGRPAIGGLLLWKDRENYLRLDRGTRGEREISFGGCLGNEDVLIGRGRLSLEKPADQQDDRPTEQIGRICLCLERTGRRVDALCSADSEKWFTVGKVVFPVDGPFQVGLYAIGNMDRMVYPGAYPDGTAIRFESFQLWGGVPSLHGRSLSAERGS